MKKPLSILISALLIYMALIPQIASASPSRFEGLYETSLNGAVYRVEAGGGTGSFAALAEQNGLALLVRFSEDDSPTATQNLVLFNLYAGEQLAQKALYEKDIWPEWSIGFLDDGQIYTLNQQDKTLTFYDQKLAESFRFTPPDDAGVYDVWLDPDGQHLWGGGTGQTITRYSLKGENLKRYESGLPEGWFFSGFLGKQKEQVLFMMTNQEGLSALGSIGESGSIKLSPIPKGFISLPGGISFISYGASAFFSALPFTGSLQNIKTWRENEYPLAYEGGLLLSNSPGVGEPIRVYDLERGTLVNELFFPGSEEYIYFDFTALSKDGYALLSYNDYVKLDSALYLWDFSRGALQTDAGIARTSLTEIRQAHDAQAADITRRFGIRIFIRQAGTDFVNDTYYAEIVDDELRLGTALDAVEAFFSGLPPGMAKETLVAPYTRLSIYLTGPIMAKNTEGISAAAGLASDNGEERYIVLNAYETQLPTNLAHEFMHLMEDRIWLQFYKDGGNLIDKWAALGPTDLPDRGFAYSYHDANGMELTDYARTPFDPQAEDHPDVVWFIDAYSRSFPLEDRARIFEHLFMAQNAPDPLFKSPHLYKKAQVLCLIIRNSFSSVQAVQQATWEKWVEPVPYESTLEMLETQDQALPIAG